MNRQQKKAVVNKVKELLKSNQATFLVGYKGLNVASLQSLRKDLREVGGIFKITKARLMKIATQDIEGIDGFRDNLKDQVGLVFVKDEVPAIAKKLVNFSKKTDLLNIISAFFESKVISKEEIDSLASLPSKEVLLAQLIGNIQAPISGLVRLLNIMIIRLLYVLKQIFVC